MTARSRTFDQVNAAKKMIHEAEGSVVEKAEMLMEIAMGLQQKPKTGDDIVAAVQLYEAALDLWPNDKSLLAARIKARMATALMAMPSEDTSSLERAREELEQALVIFGESGAGEEIAEAEMNLGLVLQNLVPFHKARIQDSVGAYQRALRTFDKNAHPKEFAILQNNIATAFLSMPFTDEKGKMREALAVQAFEEGLSIVNLIDHPNEYAMLQNNLGNALQYVSSSHRVENGFRAIDAYDEALKVRDRRNAPSEYANTIANKANCLANLPDDPNTPENGNPDNLKSAALLYSEAHEIFQETGELQKAEAVAEAIEEIQIEISSTITKNETTGTVQANGAQ